MVFKDDPRKLFNSLSRISGTKITFYRILLKQKHEYDVYEITDENI